MPTPSTPLKYAVEKGDEGGRGVEGHYPLADLRKRLPPFAVTLR